MSRLLLVRNRQRTRVLDRAVFREILATVLRDDLGTREWELCFHLVSAPEMAQLNGQFLRHEGSTDVITFDYSPRAVATGQPGRRNSREKTSGMPEASALHGEIFICVDEAVAQAKRFRTTWQAEIARYAIHGLLHLCGHDDQHPARRRAMKRDENRLLRATARRFSLPRLAATSDRKRRRPAS